jgi:hypothetical protein
MKRQPAAPPLTLLVHDGELADVRALLEAIGTPFVERLGAASGEDRSAHWDLVIASPKRILDLQLDAPGAQPTQIAILAQDSRTLRTSLRRAGIQLMVRRPVHPATLRALVVHALYRGPEKRRSARVNVGAPVRLRFGWRQRPAILVDLSVTGCRLVTEKPIERGKVVRLQIPPALSGGKAVGVRARVLSSAADRERTAGRFITTARFEQVNHRLHEQLRAAVAVHQDGPAVYEGAARDPAAASRAAGTQAVLPIAPPPPAAAVTETLTVPAVESAQCEASEPAAPDPPMIALVEEATRVLMGRDITIGGMRVSPNPLLAVGMDLSLAVHAGDRETPLVVRARVYRDEGERGMVLRFHELSGEASRYLNAVMDDLDLVDVDADGQGCLVTEVLEAS